MMGVTINATNSTYSFNTGYISFFWFRQKIASCIDKEFGEWYAKQVTNSNKEVVDKLDELIEANNFDDGLMDFLFQSDCDGSVSYKTCKKIYDVIKDVDFKNEGFRYGTYRHNDWEEFKNFLLECYSHKRKMRWS